MTLKSTSLCGPLTDSAVSAVALVESLMDAVSYGIIVLDAKQRVVLWSGWLAKVSGLATEAVLGRTLVENFPELAGSRVQDAVESALQDGFPSLLSHSLNKSPFPLYAKILPTGSNQRIQQKINVLPLGLPQTASCCLIEIFDVSLAVHREKVLDEQKKFLNTILDSEPESVIVLAADGEVIQINKAGLALFEVDNLKEIRGKSLINFILPEHQEAFTQMLARVFVGENARFEFKVEGQRGGRCWLDVNATPLHDAKRVVISLLAVGRDTTARRQAEAITRVLIDATQESAMLLDQDGRILATNEIAAQRLGETSSALCGKNFFALLPPEVAAGRQKMIDQVFSTGQPVFMQDIRAGMHFDVNIYPVFDEAGKVIRIAIYAADVTEALQQEAVDRLFHQIDQQILHGHTEQNLFKFICAEVARIFDYPFVWIERKKAKGTPTILAWGGVKDSAAADAEISLWRSAADNHRLRTYHNIPLVIRGEIFGCFNLAAHRENTFDHPATVQRFADIAGRICVAQERTNDQEQLRLLQTALSTAANGVFVTDKEGCIQWLNAAFLRMTGFDEGEVIGTTPRLLRRSVNGESLFDDVLTMMEAGDACCGETTEQRKDGSSIFLRQTITPILDSEGETTHFISILEDISATREAEAKIKQLAHYDFLTGLPNRALFNDYCHQNLTLAKRSNAKLALMFIDLDHFKQVNDTHGHNVGDLLLQQVAQRLKFSVRESDIVARLAGDEFTVLLPAMTTSADAAMVAHKLNVAFMQPFDLDGVEIQSGVSIGIAIFPDNADNAVDLLKCADSAMYEAKRAGRNGFCLFRPELVNTPLLA